MNENFIPFLLDDNPINFNAVMYLIDDLGAPVEEEEVRAVEVTRNSDYFETVVPNYTDLQFKEHFRMSRATFQNLLNVVGNNYPEQQNAVIPLDKKILYTIWLLSKQESFLAVGDRFGLSNGTGHYILKQITNILVILMPQYIKWPNAEKKDTSARIFEERSGGFPGIIGAIDGTHITIKQPPNNGHDFYNRYGGHSILLQGTCDENLKFIDIFVGMPGRMHDARVFRNSPLGQELSGDPNRLLDGHHHLIGDSAYPLSINILTPYRDNGNLSRLQIIYNNKLSSIRSTIERAFGLLKGKFRRLKYLDCGDLNLANNIITSCCVLQNFLIENHDIDLQIEPFEEDDAEIFNIGNVAADENAAMKRERITNLFM